MIIKNFNLEKKVFVIAEIGNNHEGSLINAKKLISLAAKAGANAVKFQTFKTENFVRIKDKKRFKQLKKFELSFENFKTLKEFANKKKLKFISTPLDLESANFLIKNADMIKISSGDNNFFPLIDKVLKSKKKIIISCGMLNFKDIKNLINHIYKIIGKKSAHERVALLHCVTSYPVENKYANLNSIKFLRDKLSFSVGYSDHTIGIEGCLAAISLGATIIEKHFTLDKNFSNFRDHHISADYTDLKQIVASSKIIREQLGNYKKKIQKCETNLISSVRRSAYASRDIFSGEKIDENNIKFLRPAISKNYLSLKKILGKKIRKKVLKNNVINLK